MKTINIGRDFSLTPLGRYHPKDGPFTGERFREEFLKPALENNDIVTVEIGDAEGYGSSFLHEAFAGLVQKGYYTADQLKKKLIIECCSSNLQFYRDLIWSHINKAKSA
jgi:hypothetical protein